MNGYLTGCFVVLLAGFYTGCSVPKNSRHHQEKIDEALLLSVSNENTAGKIVYLSFEVSLADSALDKYAFKLIRKTVAEGELKKNMYTTEDAIDPFHLYCEVSGENHERITFMRVEDPLNRLMEYSSEEGALGKKPIRNRSGNFSIRFQFTKNLKYLSIYRSQGASKTLNKVYYATL